MTNINKVQLLAMTPPGTHAALVQKLSNLDIELTCAKSVAEIAQLRLEGPVFEVILLPASMPELEWWSLWGELCLLVPRPSIVVYARHASFQLWTAVLDLGGFDVVAEPFGEQELKTAVLNAAEDYRKRLREEM